MVQFWATTLAYHHSVDDASRCLNSAPHVEARDSSWLFNHRIFICQMNDTLIFKGTNTIQELNCYQIMGGATMIFCKWIGLTVESSYLVNIISEMQSPKQSNQRVVECCEITLPGNGLILGKSYLGIVGPSMTTVFLRGISSIMHFNLLNWQTCSLRRIYVDFDS